MALAHAHASGMGGMRTTGDLVARMQMTRSMKIQDNKLNLSIRDLTDPVIMTEVRKDLKLGVMSPQAHDAIGIEAKFRIAEVLDIDINCVKRFKDKVSL
jgi:dimethylamine--corrinoid protein Co-methyltransferase